MKNILNKISKNKKTILVIALFCVFGMAIYADSVIAADSIAASAGYVALGGVGYAVSLLLGLIAYIITAVTGLVTTVLIAVLIQVAQFSNIINVPVVTQGWVLVRDLVNMFFVLILLVIAFATILRVESYNAKKTLPKLLIMAILINFSKTIFGLLVDFSQVIMLTFVSAFSDGGGWFINMFRIDLLLSIETDKTSNEFALTSWSTSISIIAGVVAAIIALITIAVLLGVLVMRIVMLWIYTILSPLVFLGFAFPPIQKYVGKIWEDFAKQLVVGPMLAFFLWLALTTAQNSSKILGSNTIKTTDNEVCVGAGAFFCQGNFQNFIIVIGLLIGGLMVTQSIGGAAGSIAGKGMAAAKGVGQIGLKGAKNLGGFGVDLASQKAGVDFNLVRGYQRLTAKMESNKKERASKIYDKVLSTADGEKQKDGKTPGYIRSKLALASTGSLAWSNISGGREGVGKFFQSNEKRDDRINKIMGKRDEKGEYIKGEEGKIGELEKRKEAYMTNSERKGLDQNKLDYLDNIKSNEEAMNEINKNKIGDAFGSKEDMDRYNLLDKKNNSYKDKVEKINQDKRVVDDEKIKKIDKDILEYKDEAGSYNLKGIHEERALSKSELESEGNKRISNIENPDQLVEVLKEALKDGQQGLVSAITKKLTKQGNYNEFLRAMKLGTGRNGMIDFSKHLQEKGGFTRQTALSLVGEIGELAKNVKQFAAFGAVKIENGRYTEASQDEAD